MCNNKNKKKKRDFFIKIIIKCVPVFKFVFIYLSCFFDLEEILEYLFQQHKIGMLYN